MTEEELDEVLMARFRTYGAGVHLPPDFKTRLVGAVRGRQRRCLLRRAAVAALAILALLAMLGLGMGQPEYSNRETAIVAATHDSGEAEKVSGWMLLGYLRECIRRNRTIRRKEEE